MCGKFTQMMSWGEYVRLADLLGLPSDGPSEIGTPMRFANVIALDENRRRRTVRMRWGLVPPWEKDPNKIRGTIHARAETIDQKRSFMNAFADRRGLLVVKTFNEGKELPSGKTEQYVITPRDGKPAAIAVIWERWGEQHGGSLLTFAMVTVPANTLIGTITDRMPAVIQPADWGKWLGEDPATAAELKALLQPFEGDWDMHAAANDKSPPPKKPGPQPDLF